MGVSKERKKKHKRDLIGEKKTYAPSACDYTKLGKKLPKGQRTLSST